MKWDFFEIFICTSFNTASICRLSDSTVLEDAGIKPRTIATLALAVRRSNDFARSHHTRLYLIHTRLDLIHTQPVPGLDQRQNR
jgi:hypothetical protein